MFGIRIDYENAEDLACGIMRDEEEAEAIGFLGVLAGPLVRSSYRAGRLWAQSMRAKGRPLPESLSHLADTSLGFAQAVG